MSVAVWLLQAAGAADGSVVERLGLGGVAGWQRLLVVLGLAFAAHIFVLLIHALSEWVATRRAPGRGTEEVFRQRYPKLATVLGLATSALTFVVYFLAIGLILQDLFGVNLAAYFATATVVGLAVGFGSQGLVQDVVTGLTLIFSDAMDVGDVVEVGGQVGRIERIGLRFTLLTNFLGQTVYIPNRNIGVVGRFRRGAVRAYADVQIPLEADVGEVARRIEAIARGLHAQFPAILLTPPELSEPRVAEPGGWRYLRVKFRLWPGQGQLVEVGFRQRVVAALKELDPAYADWMVTVVYRAS